MNLLSTCCFIGCQKLPQKMIRQILLRLNSEVEKLIENGVTTFISGGTPGFEQIAASLIAAKKEMGQDIRLNFVLPCKDQDSYWNPKQRGFYGKLLAEADGIFYLSNKYAHGCIKRQKRFVVDNSDYCICAFFNPGGITGKTVGYAKRKGVKIINVTREDTDKGPDSKERQARSENR